MVQSFGENGSQGSRRFGAPAVSRRALLVGAVSATSLEALSGRTAVRAFAQTPAEQPYVFFPEDYGAVGNGLADDTDAIQRCIDAAERSGGGVIRFRPAVYRLDKPPRTDRKGNAVLSLPTTAPGSVLRLEGVPGRTVLFATQTGVAYSPTAGVPSTLGGPTPEQDTAVSGFSPWTIDICGLTVATPPDPSLSGIDLSRVVRARVADVYVMSQIPTVEPSRPHSFGVRLPDGLNYGRVILDTVDVYGFYTGFVVNTAHTHIVRLVAKWCKVAIGVTGSGQFNSIDPHATLAEYVATEWCTVHIAGWSPRQVGALSANNPFYISCDMWDIEDGPGGSWYSTFVHVVDSNDSLHGQVVYNRVRANVGLDLTPLRIAGGANLALINIAGQSLSPASAAQSVPDGDLLAAGLGPILQGAKRRPRAKDRADDQWQSWTWRKQLR